MSMEIHNARVKFDKRDYTLSIYRQVKDFGPLRVMVFKLDAQCASIIGRAVAAANQGYEPDCFMLAFGMDDASAFNKNTWSEEPHKRELKP